jgi:hypothetical protein
MVNKIFSFYLLSSTRFVFISGVNTSIPPLTVLNKNGLHIIFNFEKQDQILFIHLQATNSTSIPITNFVFKAAVPRVKTIDSYYFRTKNCFF